MEEVAKKELIKVVGGGNGKWATIGIVVGVVATFLSGLLDGFLRPLKCN